MKIKISGAADARDGYGEITQNLAIALSNLGHEVWINPYKVWFDLKSLKPEAQALVGREIKPDFELIIMYPTYSFDRIHKNAAIMTMYEANRCPDEWIKKLNQLKLPIFAPSEFVAGMFKDSGVKVPISVLPLGVDSIYKPKKRKYQEDRNFRFLSLGKLEPRKNTELLVKSFLEAFKDEPVELIIKTRERFIQSSIRRVATLDKRVRIIEKTLTTEELIKLYYYCDAFVYPSRGEGFAFPPRNAVATGLPTAVTGWSALKEIPGAVKLQVAGFSPMPPCGFSYGQEKELLMADVDEEDLVCFMKSIVDDKHYYEELSAHNCGIKQYTWEDCANDFIRMISK